MIVKFFDRTEQVVSSAEADKIAKAISRGVAMIQIGGRLVNPKAIAMIVPGGRTEADVESLKNPRLGRPDYRGEPSAALEKLREKYGRVSPSEQEAA